MNGWVETTSLFSESLRKYDDKYLEICNVYDNMISVSVFSKEDKPWEIYISYNGSYASIYVSKEKAYETFESIKNDLQREYHRYSEISDEFLEDLIENYNIK